ncbi:ABC transporter [Bacillus thuringiensis]|uniref:ABC transporter ATP-binding protein n=1 Tax=Bacillus thuringiensis TaxID=1428 RepID=A0A437SQK4_BACTU|nr:ABC transporter ATP-binding protein [Bacillus thuringiensis]MBG9540263.1 ABC transporter [Bacillus thuringiensis]MBG9579229.1 ABC transporter [Bacillus thuringiensis]RVU65553.1 ABC transporter ATP-binding protein [Bacillus thuringiensis]
MGELLKIEKLRKTYGLQTVIQDVNLTISKGKIIGLVGNNGSGKTTLLKMISGLRHPSKGSITINGKKSGLAKKEVVSFMPDDPIFEEWMTVKDAVSVYRDFYSDFDLQRAMNLIVKFKIPLEENVSILSKGTIGILQLILIFSRKVKLYVLDEPLGGIDLTCRKYILDLILNFHREDSTILVSTHLIEEFESIFDEVIFLKDGNIVLHENVEEFRLCHGKAVYELFKEVFEK